MKMKLTVLSMGGGIDTAALALMLEFGQLGPKYPVPDVAIFADTQAEPPHVYETLDLLDGLLSFPILRPTLGDLEKDTWAMIRGEPVPHRGQHHRLQGTCAREHWTLLWACMVGRSHRRHRPGYRHSWLRDRTPHRPTAPRL